jgi:aspartate carbamoyltransferase regulatory subunit
MSSSITPPLVTNCVREMAIVKMLDNSKPTRMKNPDKSFENKDCITKNETIMKGIIR